MGKVQHHFPAGFAGAVTRSKDEVIISLRNVSADAIPFGAPVFLSGSGQSAGAVPFDTASPQDFSAFLGFAVRAAAKTPDTYPSGQFNTGADGGEAGAWQSGDVMEILVRGGIAVRLTASGSRGGRVYIRKSDGRLTASAGSEGSTVLLENVRVRNSADAIGPNSEVIVNTRNIL